jgi:GDP-D-mannose dehydratase
VIIKKTLFRPHDVTYLLGDCLKAKNLLGWKPKNNLKKLIDKMIKFENEQ